MILIQIEKKKDKELRLEITQNEIDCFRYIINPMYNKSILNGHVIDRSYNKFFF